jgi:hypothetical protein
MRPRHAALVTLVTLLVVLSGCSFGFQPSEVAGEPQANGTDTPTTAGGPDNDTSEAVHPPDPETDVLGWEGGLWYNETVNVTREEGLNESERQAVIARTMARIEHIRGLEFNETVPVEVVSRSEFRNSSVAQTGNVTDTFRRFDNAKFEAMFLVGEDEDALAVQEQNRGTSVLGYYDPRNGTIVLVSEGGNATIQGESTLAHELTHALQDQRFNISQPAPTRETYNAHNGLHEGDAHYTQRQYDTKCTVEWECLTQGGSQGGGNQSFHVGIYILNYFPYSDGPGFVSFHRNRGDWDAVNAMYDDLPASTEQVIYPEKYQSDEPTDVSIDDGNANGWERVRPEPRRPDSQRPDYAGLGQSGMTAMFAYTLYDSQNEGNSVVAPSDFLNLENGDINRTDPFDYDLEYTRGWDGDRMHVYETDGETAYVWKSVWDSPENASTFAEGYRELLRHYGGEAVGENTFRIDDGPYADAYRIRVEGDTVVIVNAPTTDDLADVRGGAG